MSVPIQEAGVEYPVTRSIPLDETRIRNLRFATQRDRLNDIRGGYFCESVPQTEENCPGLNILEFSYSAPESFEVLGIGTSAPGVIAKVSGKLLNFSAMAPVFLATGCCGSRTDAAFDNPQVPGTIAQSLRNAKLPFLLNNSLISLFNTPISGTIEAGGGELSQRLVLNSKIFGSKWLHIVGHSKGGLNARYVLGRKFAESQGLGIRSLVTVDTPHLGSVGADLISVVAQGDRYLQFRNETTWDAIGLYYGAKDRIKNDQGRRTQADLTQASLSRFNSDPLFQYPPPTTRVGNVTRPVAARTTVADANADASQENQDTVQGHVRSYGRRIISVQEARAFAGCSSSPFIPCGTEPAYQDSAATIIYNFLGKVARIDLLPQLLPPRLLSFAVPVSTNAEFRFSDAVVTVDSQSYNGNLKFFPLSPFTSALLMVKGVPRRSESGANHSSVLNGDVGRELVNFYRAGTP